MQRTFESQFLMFYTGVMRSASGILEEHSRNIREDLDVGRKIDRLAALAVECSMS
jgi:galactokinase/mevalonate kinase-like predicted kinase